MAKDKSQLNSYYESAIDTIKNVAALKRSNKISACAHTFKEQDHDSFIFSTALSMASANKLMFRKKADTDDALVATWLALVTNKAILNELTNRANEFRPLEQDDLKDIAALSSNPKTLLELKGLLLANYGIHLIYEHSIPGLKTDGCTFLLNNRTPVIGLSLRYSRYDYFWFTLLHELSHICLHFDRLSTPIIDSFDDKEERESDFEIEANTLAQNSLVPRNIQRNLVHDVNGSEKNLVKISNKTGIHPAILAGSIRNKTKDFSKLSKAVTFMDVREVLFNNENLHSLSQS